MAVRNIEVSVLARIKNQAIAEGISNQMGQQLFFQEEFLRRLSKSKYRENLILKGGMFLYTLTEFDSRPTRDLDFLLNKLSNDLKSVENIVAEICRVDTGNEYILLDVTGSEQIMPESKYPGVRIKMCGRIKNVRVPFSVDIGVDDVIWPEPKIRKIKSRLDDFDEPEVLTYSVESTIAEKFDAILLRMETTGRMKDFYDIYYLSNIFDFDGNTLYEAIKKTNIHRQRDIEENAMERIKAFPSNESMQIRWDAYEPAKQFGLTLEQAVNRLNEFIGPLYERLLKNEDFYGSWTSKEKKWE